MIELRLMDTKNLTEEQRSELFKLFNGTNNLMRTVMGVANNAAWAACLDALDQIKKHPRYRQSIKGGTTPRRQFKRCFDLMKGYERNLKYGSGPRFFHVADLTPEARKSYGPNFTDNDYYDMWAASGPVVYEQTKPFFTSLVNKIRLAYLNHGNPNPDIMGWAVAAQCALDIAVQLWKSAVHTCTTMELDFPHIGFRIPEQEWARTYKAFDISTVADFWEKCIRDLDDADYKLTEQEHANIMAGYNQLEEKWMSNDSIYGSRIKTAEDYAELFRTDGEMKKRVQHYAEMRKLMDEEG